MEPVLSTRNAGQPAFSKRKATSDFMNSEFQSEFYILAPVSQSESLGMTMKAVGNNSRTVNSLMTCRAWLSAIHTLAFGAYSANNWRQAPHGIGPPGARATTAT